MAKFFNIILELMTGKIFTSKGDALIYTSYMSY